MAAQKRSTALTTATMAAAVVASSGSHLEPNRWQMNCSSTVAWHSKLVAVQAACWALGKYYCCQLMPKESLPLPTQLSCLLGRLLGQPDQTSSSIGAQSSTFSTKAAEEVAAASASFEPATRVIYRVATHSSGLHSDASAHPVSAVATSEE